MSLLHWYKLDGDATDSIGNNNLTTNTAIYTPTGKIGGAYTFAATNTIYKSSGLTLYYDATITVWGYATSFASNHMLFSLNSDSFGGADLYFTGVTISWNTGDGGNNPFKNNGVNVAQPSLNVWHHYAVVISSALNKVILYLDGVYHGEAIYKSPYQINKGFTIGNYYPGGTSYAWIGMIDDVRIYDTALSPKEVKELSRAKVLHYDFDDFQEPTENIFPRSPTALAFTSAYNGASYGFGSGTNLQQVLDSNLQINSLASVTKVSRINSGVTQKDYISVDLSSPLNSIRVVSFWYYGTYGTAIAPYNNDGCANLYYLDSNGAWQGGATLIVIPVPTNQWKKITIKIVNKGSIAGIGWTWTSLHSATSVSLSNAEFWAFTMFQFEEKDHATPFVNGSRTGIVRDISGYGNDATLVLATTPQWSEESKIGKGCYSFDGATQWISPNFVYKNYESFTLSAWVYINTFNSFGVFIGSILGNNVDAGLMMFGGRSTLAFHDYSTENSDRNYAEAEVLSLNVWQHIAVTYKNTGEIYLYYNGQQVATGNKVLAGSANNLMINSIYNNSGIPRGSDCLIDDVRIYATALSATDITELYQNRAQIDNNGNFFEHLLEEPPVTDGIVGWWKMDGDATDSSGYEDHGVVSGATLTTGIGGVANTAYLFNGTSDYISVAYTPMLTPTVISVSVWAYAIDWSSLTSNTIISKTETGGYGLRVNEAVGRYQFAVYANSTYQNVLFDSSTLVDGWHHFVGTFDGRYTKLYTDGVLVGTTDAGATYPITYSVNNALLIGAEAYGTTGVPPMHFFTGKIEDVRIYNKALSQSEITLLYNLGLGLLS